jgi:hypothetical protein
VHSILYIMMMMIHLQVCWIKFGVCVYFVSIWMMGIRSSVYWKNAGLLDRAWTILHVHVYEMKVKLVEEVRKTNVGSCGLFVCEKL